MGLVTTVPTPDIQADAAKQQNAALADRFNDTVDQHAQPLIDQATKANADAYDGFSRGIDAGLSSVPVDATGAVDDPLAVMPAGESPFSFAAFSKGVDGQMAKPPPTPAPAPGPTNDKQGPRTGMLDASNPGYGFGDFSRAVDGSLTGSPGGSTPAAGGSGDVVDAIHAATDDPRVQMAMKLGASLEGGLRGPFPAGDSGGSWGPFQINHNAGMHQNIDRVGSDDPATATAYMLPEYQAAVEKVPADLWASDPKQASRLAAFYAERPAVIYDQGRVNAAWDALQHPAPSSSAQPQQPQQPTQSAPGGFAEKDVSGLLSDMGQPVDPSLPDPGAATADAGPSPSDQQTPVAQYNQRAPDGGFQQVAKMASGDYNAQPTDQPSAQDQAVYDAQDAATHGFRTPDEGAPLLAGSTAGAQTAEPALVATTEAPAIDATATAQAGAPAPAQPAATDIKGLLASALHQVADTIGGAVSGAAQQVAGTPVGPQGQSAGEVASGAVQQALGSPVGPGGQTVSEVGAVPVSTAVRDVANTPIVAPGAPSASDIGRAVGQLPVGPAGQTVGDVAQQATEQPIGPAGQTVAEEAGTTTLGDVANAATLALPEARGLLGAAHGAEALDLARAAEVSPAVEAAERAAPVGRTFTPSITPSAAVPATGEAAPRAFTPSVMPSTPATTAAVPTAQEAGTRLAASLGQDPAANAAAMAQDTIDRLVDRSQAATSAAQQLSVRRAVAGLPEDQQAAYWQALADRTGSAAPETASAAEPSLMDQLAQSVANAKANPGGAGRMGTEDLTGRLDTAGAATAPSDGGADAGPLAGAVARIRQIVPDLKLAPLTPEEVSGYKSGMGHGLIHTDLDTNTIHGADQVSDTVLSHELGHVLTEGPLRPQASQWAYTIRETPGAAGELAAYPKAKLEFQPNWNTERTDPNNYGDWRELQAHLVGDYIGGHLQEYPALAKVVEDVGLPGSRLADYVSLPSESVSRTTPEAVGASMGPGTASTADFGIGRADTGDAKLDDVLRNLQDNYLTRYSDASDPAQLANRAAASRESLREAQGQILDSLGGLAAKDAADAGEVLAGKPVVGASDAAMQAANKVDAIRQVVNNVAERYSAGGLSDLKTTMQGINEDAIPALLKVGKNAPEDVRGPGGVASAKLVNDIQDWHEALTGDRPSVISPKDLQQFIDERGIKGVQVVNDPAVMAAKYVSSAMTPMNDLQFAERLKGLAADDGSAAVASTKADGLTEVPNVPRSLVKALTGEADDHVFATPAARDAIMRYSGRDAGWANAQDHPGAARVLSAIFDKPKNLLMQTFTLNPATHIARLFHEGMAIPDASIPGAAGAKAMTASASLRMDAVRDGLHLATSRAAAGELAKSLDAATDLPILRTGNGILDATLGRLTAANHRLTMQTAAQDVQMAIYSGLKGKGWTGEAAAKTANLLTGQLANSDFGPKMNWLRAHVASTPSWGPSRITLLKTAIPGLGTKGAYLQGLSPAEQTMVIRTIQRVEASKAAIFAAETGMAQQVMAGHFLPTAAQIKAGHALDVDSGQKDANGQPVYFGNKNYDEISAIPHTATRYQQDDMTPLQRSEKLAKSFETLASGRLTAGITEPWNIYNSVQDQKLHPYLGSGRAVPPLGLLAEHGPPIPGRGSVEAPTAIAAQAIGMQELPNSAKPALPPKYYAATAADKANGSLVTDPQREQDITKAVTAYRLWESALKAGDTAAAAKLKPDPATLLLGATYSSAKALNPAHTAATRQAAIGSAATKAAPKGPLSILTGS